MKTKAVAYKLFCLVTLAVPLAPLVHHHLGTVARDYGKLMDLGRLRARLAAARWLGPLRPATPRDPLKECDVPVGSGWLETLARVVGVRRLVACLQWQVELSRQEHQAFAAHLRVAVCCLVQLLAWGTYLLRRCCTRCKPAGDHQREEVNASPAAPHSEESETAHECSAEPDEPLQEVLLQTGDDVGSPHMQDSDKGVGSPPWNNVPVSDDDKQDGEAECTAWDEVHGADRIKKEDTTAACEPRKEGVSQAEPQQQASAELCHAQAEGASLNAPGDEEALREVRRTQHLQPRYAPRLLGPETGFVEAWRRIYGVELFYDPAKRRLHIKGAKASVLVVYCGIKGTAGRVAATGRRR